MSKESAEHVSARLQRLEAKDREIVEAKSVLQSLVSERQTMLAELHACCPHARVVEAEDGMVESYDGCCDGRAGKHPARLCEDCGAYESECPQYDGWYRLTNHARSVSDEVFTKLYREHPYRAIAAIP